LQLFNDQGYSDYLVVFLRLMVSHDLQENQEFYAGFIDGFDTMKEFCTQVSTLRFVPNSLVRNHFIHS